MLGDLLCWAKHVGLFRPDNVKQSGSVVKLPGRVEHNALIRRGAFRAVHKSKSYSALASDENSVTYKGSAPDKYYHSIVLCDVVDELMRNGKEASMKGEHVC